MGVAKNFERQVGRPIVVFLLAITSVLLGYTALRDKHAALTFDVVSESNVFNVQRSLPELSVLFQDENIFGQGQNLRIIGLRIANTGDTDILQGHYDQTTPWGFDVADGRIIEVRLLGASSAYLEENVQPTVVDENTVGLRKVIIERGKYFTLEILVLHNRNDDPAIVPVGKIAGIDAFSVVSSSREIGNETFFSQAYDGALPIQLARMLGYTVLSVASIIAIGFLVSWSTSTYQGARQRARKRWAMAYFGSAVAEDPVARVVATAYERHGKGHLIRVRDILSNPDMLRRIMQVDRPIVVGDSDVFRIDGPPGIVLARDPTDPSEHILLRPEWMDFVSELQEAGQLEVDAAGVVSIRSNVLEVVDGVLLALGSPRHSGVTPSSK